MVGWIFRPIPTTSSAQFTCAAQNSVSRPRPSYYYYTVLLPRLQLYE